MKASEVHKLSKEELGVEEKRMRRQLYDLRCQAVTEKLENPRQIRNIRRDIARLLTEKQARSAKEVGEAMTKTGTPETPATPVELRSTKVGIVTSDKRNKTRTVMVNFQVRHPKYGKYLKRRTSYNVHDEENTSKLGDRVEIVNCRPLSKTKSWRLVKVVDKAVGQLEHKTEL